jgi:hypothetical protein
VFILILPADDIYMYVYSPDCVIYYTSGVLVLTY